MRQGARITLLLCLAVSISFTVGPVARAAPTDVAPPRCDSPSAVLIDAASGTVLFEKDANERRPPASVTKIMTLILTLEDVASGRVSLTDQVRCSTNAWEMGGTEVWAEPGEVMELDQWIHAVAVASANDGAVILAEYISGTEEAFVQRMNQRAAELGMSDTEFKNPHGLDAQGHLTTAMDVALMSRRAVMVPGLLDYTKVYQMPFRGGKNELVNFNKLVVLYTGCDGLKTGMTSQSMYCISATAKRDGSRFIVVIMGAENPDQRMADASRLLDWAFANYKSLPILRAGQAVAEVRVQRGKTDTVVLVPEEPVAVTIRKGSPGEVHQEVRVEDVGAPLERGASVGVLVVKVDGEVVMEVNLIAQDAVPRAGWFDHFARYLRAFVVGR